MYDYCKYQQRLIEVQEKPQTQHLVLKWINHLFGFLGLRPFWQKTFYGLKMQAQELQLQGQHIEALQLLIEGLTSRSFLINHAAKWWELMRLSVYIARDLPIGTLNHVCDPIQRLFKLCVHAPMPWRGYNVAYSFVGLSLWSFKLGKTHKAVEQVNSAIHADMSWGYPEFLLGWYGLLLEGIEPVSHFVKAIEVNWYFLECLKQDPLCQQFPEVIEAVTSSVLANKRSKF